MSTLHILYHQLNQPLPSTVASSLKLDSKEFLQIHPSPTDTLCLSITRIVFKELYEIPLLCTRMSYSWMDI